MPILLVSTDLMVASQLEGAARAAGETLVAAPPARAVASVAERGPRLAIIDLAAVEDCATLVAALRAVLPEDARIVAFGPHVHTARLDAARAAGCDQVLTRGQFLQRPGPVLSGPA
ncbi:hypothetical protein Pla175_44520 [Pirellulimonas nuda]|uniref:Response regulatory domain-containing protein n=1 Tax=Pirellulimonas nuda TaxID=2528009 RepID=A0A518DHT6_9BACT|nr:DNA-binding response regulator [Pirellulimonas nuda]QDU91035.1 hypothetical protein Pla175_44520 [Pirellulimonas nuda]